MDGADGVEEDEDGDADTGPFRQGLGDPLGDFAVLVRVLGVGDRPLGRADGFQHGREDLIPVQQQVDAVATHDRRLRVRLERRKERGLAQLEGRQGDVHRDGGATDSQGADQGQRGGADAP